MVNEKEKIAKYNININKMVCRVTPSGNANGHVASSEGEGAPAQEVADYETALDSAGYGRFSRSVLGACAGAFFTTGVENCLMSYVLPAARCELSLTTYQAGLVNMAFMCGGVASAFFWGISGDVFGRRNVLSMTLLLDALITLAQSTFSDYRLFLAARSINGFLIGCPSTLVFTYLSDLVGERRRQFYLNITGMGFVAAWLILPAVAWLIIPIKSAYATVLPVYSWRLYLAVGSIPGFVSGAWMLFLPESPRLLADTSRGDQALRILKRMHRTNGGQDGEFKIKKLITDSIALSKFLSGDPSRTKQLFVGVLKDLRMFLSKSYALKSTLILFVFFANMAAGFGLNVWIPSLLLRMRDNGCPLTPEPEARHFFAPINSTLWREQAIRIYENRAQGNGSLYAGVAGSHGGETCSNKMDDDVFTSGLIVGAICVLGNAACALLCARGGGAKGVRRAAAACALACALACACLAACVCSCGASNKVAVAAAAALNAASLNGNVLLIRLLLHALPAKLSGLGVCWGAWWGRAGGVASNLAVGALLDYSCPAPFVTVAALLAVSIGAIMMIKLEADTDDSTLSSSSSADEDKNRDSREKNISLDRYISTQM